MPDEFVPPGSFVVKASAVSHATIAQQLPRRLLETGLGDSLGQTQER